LELSDIPMQFEDVPVQDAAVQKAKVEFYPQPTNGITYLDVRSDFSVLSAEQKDLLPLFSRVLTHSGAAGADYAEIAGRIASFTGGVGAAAQVQSLAVGDDYLQSFVISGRALDRNAQPFIELLTDLISRLEIEPRRLKEIIAEIATRLESSLAGLGFQFALLRAHSKLSSEGAINDRLQGIGMLHTMRRLARLEQDALGDVIAQLGEIRKLLFRAGSLRIVVTCEEAMVQTYEELLTGLVGSLEADGAIGQALKEAILGACGDVDPLESPDIKGRREATNRATGFTRQARELFKQRLLQVTADDLRRVTRAYLLGAPAVQTTVAGSDLIDAARK